MCEVVRTELKCTQKKPGRPPKLVIEDQVLLTLEYWREYPTQFHMAQRWGLSEPTVWRITKVENILKRGADFRLPGKKKRHTIKSQVIVNLSTRAVIWTAHRPGKTHDFAVFKETGGEIAASIHLLGDSGYQGMHKEHENSRTPTKKPKGKELTVEQKREDRELSRRRIVVENVIRHLKIYRIVVERCRNRRRRCALRFNLIAGLYNYELSH